jgi:gamma-glutamylcyclotransferase (GGCT)/AIG2-like uncharacterized protein YtfP
LKSRRVAAECCCEASRKEISMPDALYPLFVYGSLRRGEENHHYLAGHFDRMLPAELAGYVRLHPLMIAPKPDGQVDGELYFLKPAEYAATMAGCDELEELSPGQMTGREYQRQLVSVATIEGDVEAWAYVQADP